MAENKNSFLLYTDIIHTVKKLPREKAGDLFITILEYVNDMNPVVTDEMVDLVFEPIKQNLKHSLVKWNETVEQRRISGKAGGIASAQARKKIKQNQANQPSGSSIEPNEANQPVNVNVNVNDIVNVINKKKSGFKKSLTPHLKKYGADVLNEFYLYWTEHNPKGKKLRFEYSKNQPFNIARRLGTWNKNQKAFQNICTIFFKMWC